MHLCGHRAPRGNLHDTDHDHRILMESGSAHPHGSPHIACRSHDHHSLHTHAHVLATPQDAQSPQTHKANPLAPLLPLSHFPSFRGSRPDPKSRAHKRSEEPDQKASAPYSQITLKASSTNFPPTNRLPHRTAPPKQIPKTTRRAKRQLNARTPARASPSASIPSAGARPQDAPNTLAPHGTAAAPHHQPPFPVRRPHLLQP